jgi:hypothetical protein
VCMSERTLGSGRLFVRFQDVEGVSRKPLILLCTCGFILERSHSPVSFQDASGTSANEATVMHMSGGMQVRSRSCARIRDANRASSHQASVGSTSVLI